MDQTNKNEQGKSTLPTYHAYIREWDTVLLSEKKVALPATGVDLRYVGQLSMLRLGVRHFNHEAEVDLLFTENDTEHHGIIVCLDRKQVVYESFVSFESRELLDAACLGADIMEGWLNWEGGRKELFLPMELYKEEEHVTK